MGDALITRRGGIGGGSATIQALSVTANGTYTASGGVDGYSPVTVNVSGGGLSTTDAILRVTAPTGSTITATKNGVVLTPYIWTQNADNTLDTAIFIVLSSTFDANAWTVTATLNGDTASTTIVINSNLDFELELTYRLPSTYQEVEYLESTGTQYINTGYTITANDKVELVGQIATSQSDNTFCETTTSSSVRFVIQGSGTTIRYLIGGGTYTSSSVGANTDATIVVYNGMFSVNGTTVATPTVKAQSYPLYLFAANDKGSLARYGKIRIKSLEISTSGTMQREFIPCYRISDSVAGLWDTTNKVFYTNDGSGTFTVGADVT